jgi:hypothetical protein
VSPEYQLKICMTTNWGKLGHWKVNNLNISGHKLKRTKRVIIFAKFMRDSALLRIVEILYNG